MKTTLLIILLTITALAGNSGNGLIPVKGCYCDPSYPGWFRSGTLLVVGERYTLKNNQSEAISVVIMPGSVQSLGTVSPGEMREFIALGTSLLISARGHEGDVVDVELRHVK